MTNTLLSPELHPRLIREAHLANQEEQSPVRPAHIFRDEILSNEFNADIYIVSELGQTTGAYKIRGAYNRFRTRDDSELERHVVAASAGNHAEAIAYCATRYETEATIFMPKNTPNYKRRKNASYHPHFVTVRYEGESVDDALEASKDYCDSVDGLYVHPFDDRLVVAGQGTIGLEIVDRLPDVDIVVTPVGGSGLLSGVVAGIRANKKSHTHFVGAEPIGAASLTHALRHGTADYGLETIDTYVDGASVKKVGAIALETLQPLGDHLDVIKVQNHELRQSVSRLHSRELAVELAGGLSVAALSHVRQKLQGRTVACILSGGNISQTRFDREVRMLS